MSCRPVTSYGYFSISGHFLSYPQEEVGRYSYYSKHPDYIFICLFMVLKGEGGGSL